MSDRTVTMTSIAAHALWAGTYDLHPNPLLSLEERTVRPLLPALSGLAVLDVACGTGRWLEQLVLAGADNVVGVDLSSEMLRQASSKPQLAPRLVKADCTELPLRTSSVDLAICSFCAGYLPDLRRFARELARVVRPDGKVVLSDFHPSAHVRGWKRSFRHEDTVVEVFSFKRTLHAVLEDFAAEGFTPDACFEPEFAEADRSFFEQCGKNELFGKVRGKTAIYVSCFIRTAGSKPSASSKRMPAVSPNIRTNRRESIAASWRLTGARVAFSAHKAVRADLTIMDGRISHVDYGDKNAAVSSKHIPSVDLEHYLILPGLINAHDHLEFNLFPRLGHGPYPNYEAWARDIFEPRRSPVREHLAVPKEVRLWWGGLKNLFSGVTTVSHHNPYDPMFDDGFPVRVLKRYGWAHSLAFDKNVVRAFAATKPNIPFIIHLGEGTDNQSRDEIFLLDRMGALDDRTVLVHGAGFSDAAHALRQMRGAALVWCPTSNRFTLGATLNGPQVSHLVRTALGSDSALTARGDLLDEIRAAHDEEGATAESLYRMVTGSPAEILRLTGGEGTLENGSIANLVALPWKEHTPAEALIRMDAAQVEMVMVAGQLHLASAKVARRFPQSAVGCLERVLIEGFERRVRAPVAWLMSETERHLPDGILLAGKRISA